jgi:hypothetical protein
MLGRAPLTTQERKKAGDRFAQKFSITTVATQLSSSLKADPQSFLGFNWRLMALQTTKNMKDGFYQDVYRNYVADSPGGT